MRKTLKALRWMTVLLGASHVHAQPGDFDSRAKSLWRQLVTPSDVVACEGFGPTSSQDGLRRCVLHIRTLIREHVMQLLDAGRAPNDILGGLNHIWRSERQDFFLLSDGAPSRILVMGYALPIGGSALPGRMAVLEGFRSTGTGYSAVAGPGISEIGHIVFLISGRNCCSARQLQKPEIWDFDGIRFERIWKTDRPLDGPSYEISPGGRIEVLHMDFEGNLPGSPGRGALLTFGLAVGNGEVKVSPDIEARSLGPVQYSPGEVRRSGFAKP